MNAFMVFATMADDSDYGVEPQEIKEFATRDECIIFMREREGIDHPDIAYWAEESGTNNVIDSCDDLSTDTSHTKMCHEHWERGLECRCIPQHVLDALAAGADPSDVM